MSPQTLSYLGPKATWDPGARLACGAGQGLQGAKGTREPGRGPGGGSGLGLLEQRDRVAQAEGVGTGAQHPARPLCVPRGPALCCPRLAFLVLLSSLLCFVQWLPVGQLGTVWGCGAPLSWGTTLSAPSPWLLPPLTQRGPGCEYSGRRRVLGMGLGVSMPPFQPSCVRDSDAQ